MQHSGRQKAKNPRSAGFFRASAALESVQSLSLCPGTPGALSAAALILRTILPLDNGTNALPEPRPHSGIHLLIGFGQ